MPRSLRQRVILLTGSTQPLGTAIVEALREHQPRLALCDFPGSSVEQQAESLRKQGLDAVAFPVDLLQPSERLAVVQRVVAHFHHLDFLINATSDTTDRPFSDSTSDELRRIAELNFFAKIELMRYCQPHLVQSYMNGHSPAIVNIVSRFARQSAANHSAVAGSEHALAGFHEAVRPEFARFDIEVQLILADPTGQQVGAKIVQALIHGGREVIC